jgi:hypothetical protein
MKHMFIKKIPRGFHLLPSTVVQLLYTIPYCTVEIKKKEGDDPI